ncbi:hypothetical protein RRG08_062915 [Elysia crispata]|uniref:Uncharacterized protein n=1 Tax=Elysia crispata TaxID=231223 RepID=A0AAE0YV46_9GAST|nr:hypothetical protein RRG08_062915 [Elysia crispata]
MDFVTNSKRLTGIYKDHLQRGAARQQAKEIVRMFIATKGTAIPLPVVVKAVRLLYNNVKDGVRGRSKLITDKIGKLAKKVNDSSKELSDIFNDALDHADHALEGASEMDLLSVPFGYTQEEESDEVNKLPDSNQDVVRQLLSFLSLHNKPKNKINNSLVLPDPPKDTPGGHDNNNDTPGGSSGSGQAISCVHEEAISSG